MRTRLSLVLLLALLPFIGWAQQNDALYRNGEVIVKFKTKDAITISNADQQSRRGMAVSANDRISNVMQQLGVREAESLMPLTSKVGSTGSLKAPAKHDLSALYLLRFDSTAVASVEDAVTALRQLDEVIYAEPNYIFHGFGTTSTMDYTSASLFNSQWYLNAINMPYLWEQPIVNEKQPLIAILDTGVDFTHPNLNGQWCNLEREPGDGIDNDGNGFVDDTYGWNFVDNKGGNIWDGNGHGTHCAGLAAGIPKDGVGIVGANPDARILDVQVLDEYMRGDEATALNGIDYAVATGADIISMSWGGYVDSEAIREALENASHSCIIVAAAGNDRMRLVDQPTFPASYPFVIAVEATDEDGELATFSNYDSDGPIQSTFAEGYSFDVRAPGVNMLSSYPSFGSLRGEGYQRMDGTSMACPLVAGAISRLMQCGKVTDFNSLRNLLIKTSGQTIDLKAAYDATTETLNAETFQIDVNGVMMTFHKTSETTAQLGDETSASIPTTISGTLSIPLIAHGLLVTALASNAFNGCSELERLILPEHIAEIGSMAFSGCTHLNLINIGSTLAPVCADDAFDDVAYTSCMIEVPQNSVQNYNTVSPWNHFNLSQAEHGVGDFFDVRIGDDEFCLEVTNAQKKTASLRSYLSYNWQETVEVPEYIGGYQITSLYYAFCDKSWIKQIILPDCITDISGQCFARSVNLETINFPSKLKKIGSFAFRDCISLKSGHIPGNVKVIDDCAFTNSGIEELILDEGVERLGIDAFAHCMKLKKIQIPSTMLSILESFGDLPYVESIEVAEGNPFFDSRENCNAIVLTNDNSIMRACVNTIFPKSVIYGGSLWGTRNLTDIVFVNNDSYEGERLPGTLYVPLSLRLGNTRGLEDLRHITIEQGNSNHYREGVDAFIGSGRTLSLGCSNSIIPDDTKEISSFAFYRNNDLHSITIPTAMTMGKWAFAGCPLTTVTSLSKKPKPFGYSAFYDSYYNDFDTDGRTEDCIYENATLYVPNGTSDIYKATEGWNNFQNIVELAPVVTGDVDGSGSVNEADRQALIDHLMGKEVNGYNSTAADADGDGCVNMRDLVALNDLFVGNNPTFDEEDAGFGVEPWGFSNLYTGRSCEVSFRTANWSGSEHPIAIYLQVMLPKGMTFDKTQLVNAWGEGGIPENIETQYSYNSYENKVDIVIYSTNNTILPDRTGVSLIVKVATDVAPEGDFSTYYSIVSDNGKMTDCPGCQPYHASKKQLELSPITSTEQMYFMYFNEKTDLYNNTQGNAYYNFNKENGDGVDTTEGAIVLSSTTTAEQMNSLQNATVGDDVLCENFHGVILEMGTGWGLLRLEAQTKGSHILNVQVGNQQAKRFVLSEKQSIEVAYDVAEPTYVYIYASKSEGEYNENEESNVVLYMYMVDVRAVLHGDINHDTSVDIADVTLLVNHILGVNPQEMPYYEGDMNSDFQYDVFDVMLLINKIMSSPLLSSPANRGQNNKAYEPLYMTAADGTILLNVENAEQFTSFQFDVEVPDGTELTGVKLTNGGTNHTVKYAKIGKNHYRVIAVSLDNTPLKTANDNVVQLMVSNNDIQINNIMFVTPLGEISRYVAQWANSTTDVDGVKVKMPYGDIYDLSGRKYQYNSNLNQKGIYIINSKKVVIK